MATSASTAKTKQPDLQPERPKENGTEKGEKEKAKEKPSIPLAPTTPSTPRKSSEKPHTDTSTPTTSTPKPGMEFVMDPAQLQALQAARGGADPAAFLSNPFLPCFMPGFPSYFPPQIPGALPGGYLQPIYGMEGLFPYGPAALSQALMGLSQGSILQQYQQYQQSIQGALQQKHLQLQQQQQQQTQKPKASPSHSQAKADSRQPSQDTLKAGERKDSSRGKPSPSTSSDQLSSFGDKPSKVRSMDDHLLLREGVVPKVKGGEQGKGGRLYDCLACGVTLNVDDSEALCRHLESPQHKRSAAERLNAKEHATHVLPHTATCAPDSAMASTSQPAPLSTLTPPSSSSSSLSSHPSTIDGLCSPPNLSTALSGSPDTTRTLASFCNQTPSSPSTVTSSLARPSSARPSMPTEPAGGTSRATMEKPLERQSPAPPEESPLGGNSRQDGSGNSSGFSADLARVGTDSLGM